METPLHRQVVLLLTRPIVYLVGFILVFPLLAQAEIYKWVDENGRTHYGDKPQTQDAETVQIKNGPVADPNLDARKDKRQRLLDIYQEERNEKKQQKAQKLQEKKKRQANCSKAKKELTEIRNSSFLYEETDDPLNPRVYSKEERNQEIAKAQSSVDYWCDS